MGVKHRCNENTQPIKIPEIANTMTCGYFDKSPPRFANFGFVKMTKDGKKVSKIGLKPVIDRKRLKIEEACLCLVFPFNLFHSVTLF